ncbi:MAG: DUF2269 domain-containing protein [Rhodospirillaceae bacterium]|nr:DUF2269 domain-containing protein [Rhodospirillaceae bacterium]
MSDPYLWLKWTHILSATLLFGTGIGTAFHMLATHRRGNPEAILIAAKNTILADWLFTAPSGIVQLATGAGLIWVAGHDPAESWLVAATALFALAIACWVKVAQLQYRIRDLAEAARNAGALSDSYHRTVRLWFILGWPAFFAFLAVFVLMVFKPTLW